VGILLPPPLSPVPVEPNFRTKHTAAACTLHYTILLCTVAGVAMYCVVGTDLCTGQARPGQTLSYPGAFPLRLASASEMD
jgi:hypothetical protein